MTILYDASTKVKPARRFGVGILPYVPHVARTFEPSESDMAWLREDEARRDAANRMYDRLADEAVAMDRMESGLLF